ncbi:hypothetical protein COOONC_10414, partial [Cooperia oncophora]
MRNSSTSSSEASPVGETEPGVSEEVNGEDTAGGSSNDTQTDDGGLCPKCGSNEDPQFIHYRKFEKLVDSNYGAFIWRYCCARKDCAEFFGDYYAYDKVSNSFVQIPEESVVPEEPKIESEPEPPSPPKEAVPEAIAPECSEEAAPVDTTLECSDEAAPVAIAPECSEAPAAEDTSERLPTLPSDENIPAD